MLNFLFSKLRKFLSVFCCVLILSTLIGPVAFARSSVSIDSLKNKHKTFEFLVQYENPADKAAIEEFKKAEGLRNADSNLRHFEKMGVERLSLTRALPPQEFNEKLAELEKHRAVRMVEPDYLATIQSSTPSDVGFSSQWHLDKINAEDIWKISKGSKDVKIAVLDSGLDLNHSDRPINIIGGHNFVSESENVQDDNGHGTAVSGLISAATNNGIGVSGVCWDCSIMPVKVAGANGVGSYFDLAQGIVWAVENGADIINLSLGGYDESSFLKQAVDYASESGVLLVAAAGNHNLDAVMYPAAYEKVLAVGANSKNGAKWSNSNYGAEIDVFVPGADLFSLSLGGSYDLDSGTSSAAGIVSALAGIWLSINPGSSPVSTHEHIKGFVEGNFQVAGSGWPGNGTVEDLNDSIPAEPAGGKTILLPKKPHFDSGDVILKNQLNLVYSEEYVRDFLRKQSGILKSYEEKYPGQSYEAPWLLTTSNEGPGYIINPQVLMTILELYDSVITDPKFSEEKLREVFDVPDKQYLQTLLRFPEFHFHEGEDEKFYAANHFSRQIAAIAADLGMFQKCWETYEVTKKAANCDPTVIRFKDGSKIDSNKGVNAETFSIQSVLAGLTTDKSLWELWVSKKEGSFYQIFEEWFGDPIYEGSFELLNNASKTPFLTEKPFKEFTSINSYYDHEYPNYSDSYKTGGTLKPMHGMTVHEAGLNQCDYGYSCYTGHDGIDYNTSNNQLYSPADARVIKVKPEHIAPQGYGNVVYLSHDANDDGNDDHITFYAHLQDDENFDENASNDSLQIGQNINAGAKIGKSGNTGPGSFGAHLHFSVKRVNDAGINYSTPDPAIHKFVDPYGWWGEASEPLNNAKVTKSYWLWGDGSEDLVIDDLDVRFQHIWGPNFGGLWHESSLGENGRSLWTQTVHSPARKWDNWAFWVPNIKNSGNYRIEAFVPDSDPNGVGVSEEVIYHVFDDGKFKEVSVNQKAAKGGWADLGSFYFDAGEQSAVRIVDEVEDVAQKNKAIWADTIRWVKLDGDGGGNNSGPALSKLDEPNLTFPLGFSELSQTGVELDWENVPGAAYYEVHIESDSIFAGQTTLYLTGESRYLIFPEVGSEINWRVKAKHAISDEYDSEWSNWRSFKIASLDVDPGGVDFSEASLASISIDPDTNELRFIVKAEEANQSDTVINLNEEIDYMKKIFLQALAVPNNKQYISLDLKSDENGCYGDARTSSPFEDTDIARHFFEADVQMKFDMFPPTMSGSFFPMTSNEEWVQLVEASPYWDEINAQGFNEFWSGYVSAHIAPDAVNSHSEDDAIFISDPKLKVVVNPHNIKPLDLSGYNFSPEIVSDLEMRYQQFIEIMENRLEEMATVTTNKMNNDSEEYKTLRDIYPVIAAAHWYKNQHFENKPYAELINSEDLSGIESDPPYDKAYWDGQAKQFLGSYSSNWFNGSTSYSNMWGGAVFRNIKNEDLGAVSLEQEQLLSDVFAAEDQAVIQDGEYYFNGGSLAEESADIEPSLLIPNPQKFSKDEEVEVQVALANTRSVGADSFKVKLFRKFQKDDGNDYISLIGEETVNSLEPFEQKQLSFSWTPWKVENTELMLVVDTEQQINEMNEENNSLTRPVTVYSNYPELEILSPNLGFSVFEGENVNFQANASDPKSGDLANANVSWESDLDGFLATSKDFLWDDLSVGTHKISVKAVNGDGYETSDFITVDVLPKGVPKVNIFGPANAAELSTDVLYSFQAEAFDFEDGNLCSSGIWSSDFDGEIGSGCNISSTLSLGDHVINFSASNNAGKESLDEINLVVKEGKPSIEITSPAWGYSPFEHEMLLLTADSSDIQDGEALGLAKFYSDLDGYLGESGEQVQLSAGTHAISAVVSDSDGLIGSDELEIVVQYTPPSAGISLPVEGVYDYGEPITLNAAANDVQDGVLDGSSFVWESSLQGYLGSGNDIAVSDLVPGSHTIFVIVSDSDGQTATASVGGISIDAGEPDPSISKPVDAELFKFGEIVEFAGSALDPSDGDIPGDSLEWISSIDGSLGSGKNLQIDALSAGEHTIRLLATDSEGWTGNMDINIVVEEPVAPEIDILQPYSGQKFLNGENIIFKADVSDYEDGTVLSSAIVWGSSLDGEIGAGANLIVDDLSLGEHVISVRATDSYGLEDIASFKIVVEEGGPVISNFSPKDGDIFNLGEVIFTADVNDYEDGDLSGASILWSSDVDGSLGDGANLTVYDLSLGSHEISLEAIDSNGNSVVETFKIVLIKEDSDLLQQFSSTTQATKVYGSEDDSEISYPLYSASFGFEGSNQSETAYIELPKGAILLNAQLNITPIKSIDLDWVRNAVVNSPVSDNDQGNAYGSAVAVDSEGNIIVIGGIHGVVNFGGGQTAGYDSGNGSDPESLFVAKYDSGGNLIWVKTLYGSDFYGKPRVSVDSEDNIVILGISKGGIAFEGISGDFILDCDTTCDLSNFLLKLNSNGEGLWGKIMEQSGDSILISGNPFYGPAFLALDSNDDIFVTGMFRDQVHIGDFSLEQVSTVPEGQYWDFSSYRAKFDKNGSALWASEFPAFLIEDMVVNKDNNLFVVGHWKVFNSPLVVGKLMEVNNEGNSWSSDHNLFDASMATDSNGNIFLSGSDMSTNEKLLLKLDSDGNTVWTKEGGDIIGDQLGANLALGDIAVDLDDNLLFTAGIWGNDIYSGNEIFALAKIAQNGEVIDSKIAASDHQFLNLGLGVNSQMSPVLTGIFGQSFGQAGNFSFGEESVDFPIGQVQGETNGMYVINTTGTNSSNLTLSIGEQDIWNEEGSFNESVSVSGFEDEISNYLLSVEGNKYDKVQVPINVLGSGDGGVKLSNLSVQYSIVDTEPPTIDFYGVSPNPVVLGENFAAGAFIEDDQSFPTLIFEYNGGVYGTFPGFLNAPSGFWNNNLPSPTSVGNYEITAKAVDDSGLVTTDTKSFSVIHNGVDLAVPEKSVEIPQDLFEGVETIVSAQVYNFGNVNESNVNIDFIIDDQVFASKVVSSLEPGEGKDVNFAWTPNAKDDEITIKVAFSDQGSEVDVNNNTASISVNVPDLSEPVISNFMVSEKELALGESFSISLEASDNVGVEKVYAKWLGGESDLELFGGKYELTLNASEVGGHVVSVFVEDAAGHVVSVSETLQVLELKADLELSVFDVLLPDNVSAGEASTVSVMLKNTGEANANASKLRMENNGNFVAEHIVALEANSTGWVVFDWIPVAGKNELNFKADFLNTIDEIDETNNEISIVLNAAQIEAPEFASVVVPDSVFKGDSFNVQASFEGKQPVSVTALWEGESLAMTENNGLFSRNLSASSSGLLSLEIIAENEVGMEVKKLVNIKVEEKLADLSVSSFSIADLPISASATEQFNVGIVNLGALTVNNAKATLRIDGSNVAEELFSLAAGESDEIYLYWESDQVIGERSFEVVLDLNNQVNEYDETNNSKSFQSELVDLSPPMISNFSISDFIHYGGYVSVSADVVDNVEVNAVKFIVGGSEYSMPGNNGHYSLSFPSPGIGVFDALLVATDSSGKSSELSYEFESIQLKPDLSLQIEELDVTPSPLVKGQNANIKFTVHNQGAANVASASLRVMIGGETVSQQNFALNKDSSKEFNVSWLPSFGNHELKISLDPFNFIAETDELNNEIISDISLKDLIGPSAPIPSVNPAGWSTNNNFNVSWSPVSDDQAVKAYSYSLNGGDWEDIALNTSVSLSLDVEGEHEVAVRAEDVVGNYSDVGIAKLLFDSQAPSSPVLNIADTGGEWTLNNFPYLYWNAVADFGSGVQEYLVNVNGVDIENTSNLYYQPEVVSGIYNIKVKAVDFMGNISDWSNEVTTKVDIDAPGPVLLESDSHDSDIWSKENIPSFSWDEAEDISGIEGYFYLFDQSPDTVVEESGLWEDDNSISIISLPSMDDTAIPVPDGEWFFHIAAQDLVGNIGPTSNYKVMIDTQAPQTTADIPEQAAAIPYSFSLTAEDYHSGVAETYYRIDGAEWQTGVDVQINDNALHTLEYYSVDAAENVEDIKSEEIDVQFDASLFAQFESLEIEKPFVIVKGEDVSPNLPGDATQSIEVELSNAESVSKIELIINRLPSGHVGQDSRGHFVIDLSSNDSCLLEEDYGSEYVNNLLCHVQDLGGGLKRYQFKWIMKENHGPLHDAVISYSWQGNNGQYTQAWIEHDETFDVVTFESPD